MASRRVKIVKWFRSDHLPEGLPRCTAEIFERAARDLDSFMPEGGQGDLALTLLVQAKDAAVRAVLDESVPDYA